MALDNEKLTERPALTNSQDTDLIHVVRGNFSYQKEAQNFNAGSISSLNDVGNVNVPAPQTDNYLYFDTNNNEWVAQPILLENLLDVVIDGNTLADGQVIAYDSNEEEWVNVDQQAGATVLNDLTDVNAPSPQDGNFLRWDGIEEEWIANNVILSQIEDVVIDENTLADGQILTYDSTEEEWVNTTPSFVDEFIELTDTPASYDCQNGKNVKVGYGLPNPTELIFTPDYMDFACSDEDSDLAVARVFTMICNRDYPYVSSVEFSVTEAPTGANLEFDVLKNGTTVYTITPSIDAGEKLTATATTQQEISGSNFNLDIGDEFQVRITQVGSTDAGAGLKATMVYNDRLCI
jgi:hypothetical protein